MKVRDNLRVNRRLSDEGIAPLDYDLIRRREIGKIRKRAKTILAFLSPTPSTIVDFGCGTGLLIGELLGSTSKQVGLIGIDIDLDCLTLAGKRLGRTTRAALLLDDGSLGSIARETIDLLVSEYTLHHLADPAMIFERLAMVLKSGGVALFFDFNPEALFARAVLGLARLPLLGRPLIGRFQLNPLLQSLEEAHCEKTIRNEFLRGTALSFSFNRSFFHRDLCLVLRKN